MSVGKFTLLASAALALAGCGGSKYEAPVYCPPPFTVADAGRLTHFKDGPGRDPRDIAYEAVLAASATTCSASSTQINVTLVMRVTATAGPSADVGTTRVPYFVRVLDSANNVTQSQEFTADFRLSSANPRGSSQEELSLSLPRDGASYRIAIGLKPTPEELNYNRRGLQ